MAEKTKNGSPGIRVTTGERVLRRIEDIVPYARNAKIHDRGQVQKLRGSLREFGFVRPLLIDADNNLIAGHGTLEAARAEGMDVVPCVLVEGLTDTQRRAYMLADNRLSELAQWDRELLSLEVEELGGLGLNMEELGFDLEPLTLSGPVEVEEDGYLPDKSIQAVPGGRCYQLGQHRLYVGDSTAPGAMELLMGGGRAGMLLTDPPYNINLGGDRPSKRRPDGRTIANDNWARESDFEDFLAGAMTAFSAYLEAGAAFYLWYAANHSVSAYRACERSGLSPRQQLIWEKQSFVLGRQDYQWRHEPCIYGWKPGDRHRWWGDRRQSTVLHFDRPTKSVEHPTMKPVKLFDYLIQNSSRPGEIVLDPFAGSGTTLAACEQSGRRAYLAEIDPHYAAVIIDRWKKLTGGEAEMAA